MRDVILYPKAHEGGEVLLLGTTDILAIIQANPPQLQSRGFERQRHKPGQIGPQRNPRRVPRQEALRRALGAPPRAQLEAQTHGRGTPSRTELY